MSGSTSPVPLSNAEQILEKISTLKEMLQKNAPGYDGILHTIHRNLSQDSELAHLLTPEQVGVIVAGLCKRKNIVLAEASSKKTSAGKNSKGAPVSIDDL